MPQQMPVTEFSFVCSFALFAYLVDRIDFNFKVVVRGCMSILDIFHYDYVIQAFFLQCLNIVVQLQVIRIQLIQLRNINGFID
jgi:hypothetical protein